jgi:hypothetical protein
MLDIERMRPFGVTPLFAYPLYESNEWVKTYGFCKKNPANLQDFHGQVVISLESHQPQNRPAEFMQSNNKFTMRKFLNVLFNEF